MKKLITCGLFCMLVAMGYPVDAARKLRFLAPNARSAPIQNHELMVRPAETRSYTQSWNIWAWNDQYVVYGLVVITKIITGTRLGVQLTVRTPEGKVTHKMVEYTQDNYSYDKNKLRVWVPNKHIFEFEGDRGLFIASFGEWGCRLRLKKTLEGFRFTNGPIRFGGQQFIGLTFAPRLEVRGRLILGGKKIPFKGVGYSDHGWQNIMPHHVSRRWYAARMISKDYTIIASQLLPALEWEPRSIPGLAIAMGDQWIFRADHRHVKLSARRRIKDKDSGYMVPQYVIYRGEKDGVRVKLEIKHQQLYDKMDILGQFNPVLRTLLRALIANPWLFRYRADFNLTLEKDGKTTQISRQGYTEWALLNQ